VIVSLLRLVKVEDKLIIPRAIWSESLARPNTLWALVKTHRLLIRTPPPKWNVVPQPLNDAWKGTWPSAAFLPPTILSPLSAENFQNGNFLDFKLWVTHDKRQQQRSKVLKLKFLSFYSEKLKYSYEKLFILYFLLISWKSFTLIPIVKDIKFLLIKL
jgi:hypothetical protein